MHFCITWVIFQQFSRRDVKLVAFLIIFHLLNYTSPLIPKLYGKMKQKLAYYEVESTPKNECSLYLSWQSIAICCVVTVNYGHFSCRHNSGIGFSKQNIYVNELNIILLYAFCSDEFKYRYNASNLYRATHDNGGWRRLSMAIATEWWWLEN